VIPRLQAPGSPGSLRTSALPATWPESPRETPSSPFESRAPLRRLRIVVDTACIDDSQSNWWAPSHILAGHLDNDLLSTARYHHDGAPADWPVRELPFGPTLPVGWITLPQDNSDDSDRSSFWYADGGGARYTSYRKDSAQLAARRAIRAYSESPASAQAMSEADGLSFAVAEALNPDLFITDRPGLLLQSPQEARVNVLAPESALAVIGLYLRTQGDYRIFIDPGKKFSFALDKASFFWVAAHDLFPDGWRWLNGTVQHSRSTGKAELPYLATGFFDRMAQALKNRDALNAALHRPSDSAFTGDTLDALEAALMQLMAAVDITASVVHLLLDVGGSISRAGWQSDGWRARFAESEPALARIGAAGTVEHATLTVLRHLRNSIHGPALVGAESWSSSRDRRVLMGLPRARQAELLDAMTRLGGPAAWGVETWGPDEFYADPGLMLEVLIQHLLPVLDQIMRATPVERVAGVNLSRDDHEHPQQRSPYIIDTFSIAQRACVRTLLGL
jgi:hypothetical protein